jgi:hypothetical protein
MQASLARMVSMDTQAKLVLSAAPAQPVSTHALAVPSSTVGTRRCVLAVLRHPPYYSTARSTGNEGSAAACGCA